MIFISGFLSITRLLNRVTWDCGQLNSSNCRDLSGNLWIGTHNGGVNLLNRNTGYISHNFLDAGTTGILASDQVEDLAINKDGHIWAATRGGLFDYDPVAKTYKRYLKQTINPFSLSDSNCLSIYFDHLGTFG